MAIAPVFVTLTSSSVPRPFSERGHRKHAAGNFARNCCLIQQAESSIHGRPIILKQHRILLAALVPALLLQHRLFVKCLYMSEAQHPDRLRAVSIASRSADSMLVGFDRAACARDAALLPL